MSRSKKGSKGPGFDYWGKRGIKDKKTTNRMERAKARAEVSKEFIENRKSVRPKNKD